jgi:hypothetical protein
LNIAQFNLQQPENCTLQAHISTTITVSLPLSQCKKSREKKMGCYWVSGIINSEKSSRGCWQNSTALS